MAVATSATQLSRSMGSAIGLAVLGTILTQGMTTSLARYLPPAALKNFQSSAGGAGAVFDPSQLARLSPAIAAAIRHGLSDALHPVFVAGLIFLVLAFVATLFIEEVPLRQTAHVTAGRTRHEAGEEAKSAV
jgi:hypothetical protein